MMQVETTLKSFYKGVDERLGKTRPTGCRRPNKLAVAPHDQAPAGLSREERYIWSRCQEFGIGYDLIISGEKSRQFAAPRQLLYYELHKKFDLSYEQIGQLMGGRHHTTILGGIHNVRRLLGSTTSDAVPDVQKLMGDQKLHDQVKSAYQTNISPSLIEERYGISRRAVAHIATVERWQKNGDRSTEPKFRLAQMRREYYGGKKLSWICEKHGISSKVFLRLRQKLGWEPRKRVTDE